VTNLLGARICNRAKVTTMKVQNHPSTTTEKPGASRRPNLVNLPPTFRLPGDKQKDPVFSFSRAWYYKSEREGRISLIRLVQPGKRRGITLVPTAQILNLIDREGL